MMLDASAVQTITTPVIVSVIVIFVKNSSKMGEKILSSELIKNKTEKKTPIKNKESLVIPNQPKKLSSSSLCQLKKIIKQPIKAKMPRVNPNH
ncbi:hypothetical protein D0T90_05790 [Neisseria animalis]|uniref:Uncharacterized protein n=1 Tax=Neisseria animalis TaxID=492 RepID=A0A5P3MSJ4_NEIAN|nr:hypothetical protein D0T90_05790 [Neisseria animalis]